MSATRHAWSFPLMERSDNEVDNIIWEMESIRRCSPYYPRALGMAADARDERQRRYTKRKQEEGKT